MIRRLTDEKLLAYISLILGLLCFAGAEAVIRFSSRIYPDYEILLYRSLFLLVFVVIVAATTKKLHHFKTTRLDMHMLRSVFSAGSFLFAIKALTGLKLYSFKALSFVSPIFIVVLGVLILKEQISKKYVLAFLICLFGVFIAFEPGSEVLSSYGFFGICSALCAALAVLTFKKMAPTETTLAIILYYSLACIFISFFLIDFSKLTFSLENMELFALMAFFHLIASFFYTYGLRIHNLTAISMVNYLALPISMALGFALWREWPATNMLIAGVLITLSNIVLQIKKSHFRILKRK